jgi:gamma-glutamylputrescine oxidase
MAGLHTALELVNQWIDPQSIVLVEKGICGSGMSGRSWGFLTPDSELGLRSIERKYGKNTAEKIRSFGSWWQNLIKNTANSYWFSCDLRDQDSLLLGIGNSWKQACKEEHEDRKRFNLNSTYLNSPEPLDKHISACCYTAGTLYDDCFGIDAFAYCQQLKNKLVTLWIQIYEHSTVDKIKKNKLITNCATILFKNAIFCPGKVTHWLSKSKSRLLYGVTNFITISEPLTDNQIKDMMPSGELMCRDTDLVFNYFRVIDGNRIIFWWWNPISAFLPREIEYDRAIKSAINTFKKYFPSLKWVKFNEYRSGRIQVTKDLMPIIDTCNDHENHIRVLWCAGLPRAAACGQFAARKCLNKQDNSIEELFKEKRSWLIPWFPISSFWKSIVFSLSNAWAMFREKMK